MPVGLRVAVLALLLALGQAHASDASVSIFWRLAVLSFDNPGTQQSDEAATASVPHADPAGEAIAHLQAAATSGGGRVGIPVGVVRPTAAFSFGITRAPPAR